MPQGTQVLRNFYVNDNSDSLDRYQSTSFTLNDFFTVANCNSFASTLANAWSEEVGEFFETHSPQVVLIQYGQNICVENGRDVLGVIQRDFDLTNATKIQVSIAANVGITRVVQDDNHNEDNNDAEIENHPIVDEVELDLVSEDNSDQYSHPF
jgi:hypothetical protein